MVRAPFKMETNEKRRFVRLEISAPMSLQTLKDCNGGFWPEGDTRIVEGIILNISGGGVLADLTESINSGDVVAMRFILQDQEPLDDVLGMVKRVEASPEGCLTGIEFVTRKRLEDVFSKAEMDLLPQNYTNFAATVGKVLSKYVSTKRPTV
jgi:hypothetical protein